MTSTYFSYLLRIWQSDEQDDKTWLASLEVPGTHKLFTFQNLELLLEFIRNLTTMSNSSKAIEDDSGCK